MERLSKLCSECLEYVAGRCAGKEQATVKAGKKPCKKYLFATDELVGSLDNEPEPTDEQLEATEPEPVESEPQSEPEPKIRNKAFGSKSLEMKQHDFQRLSAARLVKAIAAIKLLGNLNNKYAYDYADSDVKALRTTLENTITDVFGQF